MMLIRLERRPQRGFAFIAALMVILVIAILIMAILTMALSGRLLSGSRHEYTQAVYLGEAGVNAMIADWRAQGVDNPPAQPYEGVLENGGAAGGYHVTWTADPTRDDWIYVTSTGTANTAFPGTVYNVNRTVEVRLDTDGDWAWNHVYYSDSDQPGMEPPEYAVINGNGDVEIDGELGLPSDFTDHPNGPGGGAMLPSPMWDKWHDWVQHDLSCDPETEEQIPRDPDGDGTPDPRWPDQATFGAITSISFDAIPDDEASGETAERHMFWYGSSASAALDSTGHDADGHAVNDENFFMPDWYGEYNPDAYVCNSTNKRFTVTFADGEFTGNYFVHGDIHVKRRAHVRGTLVATGNIYFYGVENASIQPEVANPEAPCDERVYYPALIAGGDVLVRDQGVGDDDSRERLRVSGIVWAGGSYTGQASNIEGCVVSPNVRLGGNFLTRYGIYIDGCEYKPGETPPPWFREPDRGEMQPIPRTWRER